MFRTPRDYEAPPEGVNKSRTATATETAPAEQIPAETPAKHPPPAGLLFDVDPAPEPPAPYTGPWLSLDDPIPFTMGDGAPLIGHRWTPEVGKIGTAMSLDTETTAIDHARPWLVPELVIASVSTGTDHYLILPEDIAAFLEQHHSTHLIFHNAKFDYEVIHRFLLDESPLPVMADRGQIHDTGLLARLVDIAIDDYIRPAKGSYALDTLCHRFLKHGPDKESGDGEYRTRYGELLDHDWGEPVESGFLTYALSDAVYTIQLWQRLIKRTKRITQRFSIGTDLIREYGYSTEVLQTRADIALGDMSRTGLCIDSTRRDEAQQLMQAKVDDLMQQIQIEANEFEAGAIFERYKTGEIKYNDSGSPKMPEAPRRKILEEICRQHGITPELTAKSHEMTLGPKFWSDYTDVHPFIDCYVNLKQSLKLQEFFAGLSQQIVHSTYNPIVRTGRVSASKPNVQQIPRDPRFRSLIIAPEGKLLWVGDFKYVELVTLAHVCETRIGYSKLGEAIRAGMDPHAHLASMLLQMDYQDFLSLKTSDKPKYNKWRTHAKICSFGFPGGLASETLVRYAKRVYKLEMSSEQADQFREKYFATYPEVREYVELDDVQALANALRCDRAEFEELEGWELGVIRKVASGRPYNSDGEPYSDELVDKSWDWITETNQNPYWESALATQDTKQLFKMFMAPITTLSGRVRGPVNYNQQLNTPFQGAASDGAKAAMWRLYREGFQSCGFIHDEFLVYVDEDRAEEQGKQIETICIEEMQQFTGTVPVAMDTTIGRQWEKP